ncbi:MAG: hypothetical protein J6P10_01245 [Aeriscardovia sp.]|nr:hypothetical protein [Aeriscardovia sp.]
MVGKLFSPAPGGPVYFSARQFGFKIPFSGIGRFSLIGVLQISGLRIFASLKSALPSKNLLAAIPMNLNCQEPHLGFLVKKGKRDEAPFVFRFVKFPGLYLDSALASQLESDSQNLKPPPKKAQRFLMFVSCL